MSRVIHFEISAENPRGAAESYAEVFDWVFQKWNGRLTSWNVAEGPGESPGGGGRCPIQDTPGSGQITPVDEPSVGEFAAKICASGGKIVIPPKKIPGIGDLVYCQDREGNVFRILQEETPAP